MLSFISLEEDARGNGYQGMDPEAATRAHLGEHMRSSGSLQNNVVKRKCQPCREGAHDAVDELLLGGAVQLYHQLALLRLQHVHLALQLADLLRLTAQLLLLEGFTHTLPHDSTMMRVGAMR